MTVSVGRLVVAEKRIAVAKRCGMLLVEMQRQYDDNVVVRRKRKGGVGWVWVEEGRVSRGK